MQRTVKRVGSFLPWCSCLASPGGSCGSACSRRPGIGLLYQIYELPASTTADQLKQAGYLDLTAPQSSRLVEVDTFFSDNALAGDNILKTFTVEADEPVIRVFCRDKNSLLVKMTTYYVRQQFAEDPGRPFDLQREERAGADGDGRGLAQRPHAGRPSGPESDLLLYCHAAEQPWLCQGSLRSTSTKARRRFLSDLPPCGRLPDMPYWFSQAGPAGRCHPCIPKPTRR